MPILEALLVSASALILYAYATSVLVVWWGHARALPRWIGYAVGLRRPPAFVRPFGVLVHLGFAFVSQAIVISGLLRGPIGMSSLIFVAELIAAAAWTLWLAARWHAQAPESVPSEPTSD